MILLRDIFPGKFGPVHSDGGLTSNVSRIQEHENKREDFSSDQFMIMTEETLGNHGKELLGWGTRQIVLLPDRFA